MLQDISKLLRFDGDWASHKFGHIVTLKQLTMIVGIGARQLKWLAATTISIDMSYKRTGVVGIIAATTEHYPTTIARP